MRILYVALTDTENPKELGIWKKVEAQRKALEVLGHEVAVVKRRGGLYTLGADGNQRFDPSSFRGLSKSAAVYRWLAECQREDKYELVYFRFSSANSALIRLLKIIRSTGTKIVVEFPTFPFVRVRLASLLRNIRTTCITESAFVIASLFLQAICCRKFKYLIDGVVTYTDHEMIYGIKTIRISNGIDVDTCPISKHTVSGREYEILAVANVSLWHGFDRVIAGLAKFYSDEKNNCVKIVFRIVGVGDELDRLRTMVAKLGLQDIVIFEGAHYGERLDDFFDRCDIAVGALGLFRVGLGKASALKAREYIARGVPFVSVMDNLVPSGAPYMHLVSNCEEPIDICEVVSFIDRCRLNGYYQEAMLNFTVRELPWEIQMRKVLVEVLSQNAAHQ